MKLTGSYKLNVKKEIVWNALNDPKILKQCIPGCDSFVKENEEIDIPILEIRNEVQQEQIDRLKGIKESRDNEKVEKLLKNITISATNGDNVMQPIIDACLEYATLGEIVAVMKVEFGEWQEATVF